MTGQNIRLITPQELGDVTITATNVQATTISIPPNGKPMVTIRFDGTLEYGSDYTPDAAALLFWDAVQRLTPPLAVREFGPQLHASINQHLRDGQEAEKKLARLDQMAAAWLERLPDTIRTATAVEAVHQITRGDAG